MTDSPVTYRTISSSRAHSDVHEDGVGGDEVCKRIPAEARVKVKWTYFVVGCAFLLPWNALLNATPFFLSRLAGSPFYSTFGSYLSSVYTCTKCVFQLYCTITSKQSSTSRRIVVSINAMILLITSLFLSTFIRGTPSTWFGFTLFSSAAVAVTASYLGTAVIAEASLLGYPFLQPALSGPAAIGVVVSAVQVASAIFALWVPSPKPISIELTAVDGRDGHAEEIAARIFFAVSAIFLAVILSAYRWLMRQSFTGDLTVEQHCAVGGPDECTRLIANSRRKPSAEPNSHVYRVFRQNLTFMFSIAYVAAVAFAVYPAITVRVRSVDLGIQPLLFTSIHFLIYTTGEFLGRHICSYPRFIIWSETKILVMSLLRTLFVPLILLCNVDRAATTLVSPIIRSDLLFMVILLMMGYSAGYVATVAVLAASSLEHNPRLKGREDVDVVATLGGSCLSLGLAFGALSSFGVQAIVW